MQPPPPPSATKAVKLLCFAGQAKDDMLGKCISIMSSCSVADLHSNIVDTPPPQSNCLNFYAVFRKKWLNNKLVTPLENFGSAPDVIWSIL